MKRWALMILMLAVWTLIDARWCAAQCGPGGCCPGGSCAAPARPDFGGWRASNPHPAPPASVPQANGSSRYETRRGCYKSVVRVTTDDGGGRRSLGSGVALNWNGYIIVLTASHVVRDARAVYVANADGKHHQARILNRDAEWDVAVLQPLGPGRFDTAPIAYRATGTLSAGQRLEACGWGPPLADQNRLAVHGGRFLRYVRSRTSGDVEDWLLLSGTAREGDSGGPVFNRRGEVVGILWGTGGGQIVAAQCGRLHVVLEKTLGPQRVAVGRPQPVAEKRVTLPPDGPLAGAGPVVGGSGLLERGGPQRQTLLPICRPNPPAPAPRVVVQADPRVGDSLASIDAKLDQVIQNTTPPTVEAAPEVEPEQEPEAPLSPVILLLVIGGAVVLGFVVYFAAAK